MGLSWKECMPFILLVGVQVKRGGECGRIADSLNDFFVLMINCPYWLDYVCEKEYQDREELSEFAKVNLYVQIPSCQRLNIAWKVKDVLIKGLQLIVAKLQGLCGRLQPL